MLLLDQRQLSKTMYMLGVKAKGEHGFTTGAEMGGGIRWKGWQFKMVGTANETRPL